MYYDVDMISESIEETKWVCLIKTYTEQDRKLENCQ